MNVLSIDVGIKNLALCLFNIESKEDYKILDWNVVNLCNEINKLCKCGKKANYKFENIYSCKKHTTDYNRLIIPCELEINKLKKLKIANIRMILEEKQIVFDKTHSKIMLIEYLHNYLESNYFTPFSNKVNTNDLSLIEIGINMREKLNEIYKNIKIDTVIIENQISPIANRMKTLQGMIAQYFIMNDINDIHFISASNKLKDYVCKKTTYIERKSKGIEICEEILINNEQFSNNLEMFHTHKKKDDLADCFLQGLWFLKDKIIYN